MNKTRIGFDLGGTNMRSALIDYDGNIIFESNCKTIAEESSENIINRIKTIIYDCIKKSGELNLEVQGIGIGCPGLIESNEGIVRFSPNIPAWKNFEIKKVLNQAFELPVFVENDVRAATMGELNFGAGKGKKNLICITLGTGIGSGIVLEGKLLRGPSQTIGEIGHMTLDKHGPKCGCGNNGCFEALASATAMIKKANSLLKSDKESLLNKSLEAGKEIDAQLICQAAKDGDRLAKKVIKQTANWIGIGLANVVNLLNPEMIIIGGGVSLAGDILFDPIRKELDKRAMKIPSELVKIVPAQLGNSAGIIGASTLVG